VALATSPLNEWSDVWIFNTIVLPDNYVPLLLQLQKDSLFVTVRNAALKLKHGTD